IIVHGVPLVFDTSNPTYLKTLMGENVDVLDSLQRVIWANQVSTCDPKKTHSSIIIHLMNPLQANIAIHNKVSVDGCSYQWVLQCYKCHDFGHPVRSCPNSATLCSHCAGEHTFKEC
ncbi:hypothetical protein CROQUDRAFT_20389, partial [Cronartium quercuum f. sp. fusiforme G11]